MPAHGPQGPQGPAGPQGPPAGRQKENVPVRDTFRGVIISMSVNGRGRHWARILALLRALAPDGKPTVLVIGPGRKWARWYDWRAREALLYGLGALAAWKVRDQCAFHSIYMDWSGRETGHLLSLPLLLDAERLHALVRADRARRMPLLRYGTGAIHERDYLCDRSLEVIGSFADGRAAHVVLLVFVAATYSTTR